MKHASFLDIYRGLIETPSISANTPEWDQSNHAVIEKLATWFQDLKFSIQVIDVAPGKQNLLAKMGHGDGGLLFSGHSDTVPFDAGRWNTDPHQLIEKDNRFYGLGTADMKGFFAFILEAAKSVDWSKQKKPLYVLATCDEETSMLGAQHFTKTSPIQPDFCIIGEPTSLKPIRAHKGHVAKAIRVTGKSGHSSNPALGINAIEIMNEVLFSLMQLRNTLIKKYHNPGFEIPEPTMNFGHIHGGDSANRICGCCELHFDIRPLPEMSLEGLDHLIRDSLQEIQVKWPKCIDIQSLHDSIPGYECPEHSPFIQSIEQLTQQKTQTVNYCTEAPFLQQVCPTLVLGPGSIDQAHQPDEFLSFDFIQPTTDILTKAIYRYCF